ncbi:hypothetical protein [Actinomadura sp. DC4]|uniref:hypothetical protein n=1 Tax=Actinomadura sp. DC4 TaxID=3055069 RepID=UPI0025B1B19A|nr:hypothetical protein [Actinomadura sp. DC4]MDN3354490.1 hypothetical protein [Actinomadura sp. DC4]
MNDARRFDLWDDVEGDYHALFADGDLIQTPGSTTKVDDIGHALMVDRWIKPGRSTVEMYAASG